MSANEIASQFAQRINDHGWVRLTAKQTAWLMNVARREGLTFRTRYAEQAEGHLGGDTFWRLLPARNGSGVFSIKYV